MLEPDVLVELIEPYRKPISKQPSNIGIGVFTEYFRVY